MPKVFIIAGEPSGDLHGANLVESLLRIDPEVQVHCWGGDRMRKAGAHVLKHVDDLAFMGFVEVLINLPTIYRNFKLCRQQIEEFQPDLVVLIDYPGFNLRMARHIKKLGMTVAYYISPQIWAWKESRVHQIKRFVDHVFVILPFEKDFYARHGVDAEFVGHPLLDEIAHIEADAAQLRKDIGIDNSKPIIAILPGSRKQEINRVLPPIAKVVHRFPEYQFVVSKVSWQPGVLYQALPNTVAILEGRTYELLKVAEAAIVTSGTATLETALIGTPQVVVYKANGLSILIARFLVRIKFISLVNLLLDEEAVTELIQGEVTGQKLTVELRKIVEGGESREQIQSKYAALKEKIGTEGASEIVANRLLKIIGDLGVSGPMGI